MGVELDVEHAFSAAFVAHASDDGIDEIDELLTRHRDGEHECDANVLLRECRPSGLPDLVNGRGCGLCALAPDPAEVLVHDQIVDILRVDDACLNRCVDGHR